jgi:hypothetical protein
MHNMIINSTGAPPLLALHKYAEDRQSAETAQELGFARGLEAIPDDEFA